MSYDLEVWTTRAPDLEAALSSHGPWEKQGGSYCHSQGKWQVVVFEADRVEPEDVPFQVTKELPGIAYVTHLSVEPISAPKTAVSLARRAAAALAKQAHGVVLDPQDDSVSTAPGVKRFHPEARTERFAIVEMAWWFMEGPLLATGGLDTFVDLIDACLPEALPKRYGLYEPPQHRLAYEGLAHFKKFLADHSDELVVWYPSRPVTSVNFMLNRAPRPARLGFACNHLDVSVEASALLQPGWQAGIETFWRRASKLVRPFFGDVRTLGGCIRMGGTYAADMQTEFGPTRGPFWRGVPRDPGHACVLGPRYADVWPGFRNRAREEDGLAFVSCERWERPHTVLQFTGPVPDEISQRRTPQWTEHKAGGGLVQNWNTEYPAVWPLGERPPADPEW